MERRTRTVEWRVTPGLTGYAEAVTAMDARAAAIRAGAAAELIWLVEHPPLYTAGTSADPAELIEARFPVHMTGRGGRHTYHGPGQRVVYAMIDLDRRGRDVRAYVHALEGWAIAALGDLGVTARAVPGRVGIWTDARGAESKIGAIGVRVRRWVTTHGIAINVDPVLDHFGGIVPCGLSAFPVTSLAALNSGATIAELDARLKIRLHAFLEAVDLKMIS